MEAVGIDLGTTFSAIAHIDSDGRPVVICNERGKSVTPSIICFKDGAVVVGEEARELQAIGLPTAAFFKREMGQESWAFPANGRTYSAVDLSALILAQLKRDAECALKRPVIDAVITVPAYFRNAEREATVAAGKQAGLNVLQIVNEPTAAAIAYGSRVSAIGKIVLVYDLGGGTFDVTLLRIGADEIRVLTSNGDHELGGKDWDDRILQFVRRRFMDEFGTDPTADIESVGDLWIRAEDAKKQLSAVQSTRISLVHEGNRGNYEINRQKFEEISADLLERTISLTQNVLDGQKLSTKDVGGVLLVGGSTRMPMVQEFIKRQFNQSPLAGVNVDEAVAAGAALLAAERVGRAMPSLPGSKVPPSIGPRRRTVDVTNHSLGMIAVNATRTAYVNSIILPKNQVIPCVQSKPYQHRARRQSSLEVYITQGESELPAQVSYLGRHTVHDIPSNAKGLTIIDVEYHYDESGTVQVGAKVNATGQELRVTVDALPPDVPARFAKPPEADTVPQHVTAYLAFDLSGSMSGDPLIEAQKAAHGFLNHSDLTHCSIGIIGFSDSVATKLRASQNSQEVEKAIDGLVVCETGVGNGDQPFDELLRLMGGADGPRFGVVLADGVWSNQPHAISRAKACKDAGIDLISVGFGGADEAFLKQIASSDEGSFFTSLGGLVETFSNIAQVLTETGGGLSSAPPAPGKRDAFNFLKRG